MMGAIERIAGYACQVNEDKWRELVKVAYRVELSAGDWASTSGKFKVNNRFAWITDRYNKPRLVHRGHAANFTLIPYPDFLAKLKGEEKWEPKQGDMVELSYNGTTFTEAIEYIAYRGGHHWAWQNDEAKRFRFARPLRPTITRKEAEDKLKEFGVSVRIID